jgi:hypothetical protein
VLDLSLNHMEIQGRFLLLYFAAARRQEADVNGARI